MKLTIALITMNRSEQLIEAIDSCMKCELPKETEFVIIDNASTDDTEAAVKSYFSQCAYNYYYEKLKENIGAGSGRNYAFRQSKGEYVYYMDDDAYIDYSKDKSFFIKAIEIFERDKNIATITTQIYDLAWKRNRVSNNYNYIHPNIKKQLFVCGGSHFIRASVYKNEGPNFDIHYGFEETKASLYSRDRNLINIFAENLLAIHNPRINKWDANNDLYKPIMVNYLANKYSVLSSVYPKIFNPLLFSIMLVRWVRLPNRPSLKDVLSFIKKNKPQYSDFYKIRFITVLKLFKDFGFSIF